MQLCSQAVLLSQMNDCDSAYARMQAGYEVVYPKEISGACCGMIFNTRGFATAASKKMSALEASLLEASEGGKLPIICDTSPCLAQIKTSLSTPALRFALYEPVEFISHFLVDKLNWKQVRLHPQLASVP